MAGVDHDGFVLRLNDEFSSSDSNTLIAPAEGCARAKNSRYGVDELAVVFRTRATRQMRLKRFRICL